MSVPAESALPFVPDTEEPSFPLVVVRVGVQGSSRPPPPSSRARPRVQTLPGLGDASRSAGDEVDELLALSDPEFYFPPEG